MKKIIIFNKPDDWFKNKLIKEMTFLTEMVFIENEWGNTSGINTWGRNLVMTIKEKDFLV